jgi:hypothetical protein
LAKSGSLALPKDRACAPLDNCADAHGRRDKRRFSLLLKSTFCLGSVADPGALAENPEPLLENFQYRARPTALIVKSLLKAPISHA